jgi:hypothetical protein
LRVPEAFVTIGKLKVSARRFRRTIVRLRHRTSNLQGRGQRGRLIPVSGQFRVVREVKAVADRRDVDPTTGKESTTC